MGKDTWTNRRAALLSVRTMNLYYNTWQSDSKCNWVMDSLLKGWPGAVRGDRQDIQNAPSAVWGIIENNSYVMKNVDEYWFWDMPFWGRWTRTSTHEHYWHAAKNNFYPTDIRNYPSDRFDAWNVKLTPYTDGKHILICPSSDTMTLQVTGQTSDQWLAYTITKLKKHTDRPVVVRHKPRINGMSGPDAESLSGSTSVQADLMDAYCVVTTVSLVALEAQLAGIPTFCHPRSFAAGVSETDLSKIEYPKLADREAWLNWLAYNQFTEQEIATGFAYNILQDMYK